MLQLILDSLPFSVVATDTDGAIVATNAATERLLGYRRNELTGQPALLLHDPDELRRRASELSQKLGIEIADRFQLIVAAGSRSQAEPGEWTYLRKDGSCLSVNLDFGTLRDESGEVEGYLVVAYDASERKRAEAYIRRLANFDEVTGLPNRTLLLDQLRSAIRHAQQQGAGLAVLMLDLDHFKRVNDSLGHQVGDKLLIHVSRRIRQCLREGDVLARFGGDEFVIVLPEVRTRQELAPIVTDIVNAVAAPLSIDRHELDVTPSIGACLFPDDGDSAETLLRNADNAMYQAKSSGRGTFHWFTQNLQQNNEEKLALGIALRRAVDGSAFDVHYQPEISLSDGRVIGMEALVRWHHAVHGMIPPDRFVPVAEESGLIFRLGEWVLRTACFQCVQLQRQLGIPLVIAVNVSPRQFQHQDLLEIVRKALADSQLDPRHLELEITEGVLMQNPEGSAVLLDAIRKLGTAVVIDDFGTGYSSLSYLARLSIDKIKIDRSFVRDIINHAAGTAITNAIIAMAHTLNLRVVAEGVENRAQRDYLKQRGCDEAQGFYYSKAVPAGEFAARIAEIRAQIPPG